MRDRHRTRETAEAGNLDANGNGDGRAVGRFLLLQCSAQAGTAAERHTADDAGWQTGLTSEQPLAVALTAAAEAAGVVAAAEPTAFFLECPRGHGRCRGGLKKSLAVSAETEIRVHSRCLGRRDGDCQRLTMNRVGR